MPATTRAAAINAHCRACIVDNMAAGTWREQVATCTIAGCALFPFRPVPRHCITGGQHDRAAIAATRAKLDVSQRDHSRTAA
jgi:hypothetical protein